jgi:translation initiation factor 2B subunit (eIF-2B alpha/beta/delta family)
VTPVIGPWQERIMCIRTLLTPLDFADEPQFFSPKDSVFYHLWIAIHICEYRNCSKLKNCSRAKIAGAAQATVHASNYGFDLTPARLVSALITERGED